jgi:RimJ/RimL family protein N-acetyltransferase
MHIRVLTRADAAEFQALRLNALGDNPEAFGRTFAEERHTPIERVAERLGNGDEAATRFVLGAAETPDGPLRGLAGCFRESSAKERHKAVVWGMYVVPELRGQGVGRQLLDAVIARAAQWPGLEQLTLSVVPENVAARTLYMRRGFVTFGVAPRALAHDGRYFDLEYRWLQLTRSSGGALEQSPNAT